MKAVNSKRRVQAKVRGVATRPRLAASISVRHVVAQLIDDASGVTLAYSSSVGQKLPANLTKRAQWVGSDIATKARGVKVKAVAFDRGNKRYHGRLKALAEAARQGGLEF